MMKLSVTGHYVEIIADKGINDVVKDNAWETIVARFVDEVKHNRVADGFLAAINTSGILLTEHLPATDKKTDGLTNHLIEL